MSNDSSKRLLEGEGPVVLVSHGITGGIDQGKWITSTLGGVISAPGSPLRSG